ncbi:MAG: trigger factor [bacterium]
MKVEKKNLEKSQVELRVEMTFLEFEPYISKAAEKISKDVKIDGFRPGKAPLDVVKKKIGEMAIMEEAANIVVNKTIGEVIEKNMGEDEAVGQPQVDIIKLAPNNSFEYKITLAIMPGVELGEYKNLKIKKIKVEIGKEEVEKVLQELAEMGAKEVITVNAARNDDKVLVDIQMFQDNVPVEGGQSKGAAIVIGKNYIVPGFDKHLIGAKKGDKKDFSLPYPEKYHMKNLAGKMVDFKVEVCEVYAREISALDDKLAEKFGFKKFAELEEKIKKNIQEQKEKEADLKVEREMLDKLISQARFGDVPEILVGHEARIMMSELEEGIAQQGGKFEDYLASIKKTKNELTLEILPEAMKRVKASLLVKKIAEKEGVEAEKDEVEKNIKDMKETYKDVPDAAKKVDSPEYREYIKNVLSSRKTIDRLKEWNISDVR